MKGRATLITKSSETNSAVWKPFGFEESELQNAIFVIFQK